MDEINDYGDYLCRDVPHNYTNKLEEENARLRDELARYQKWVNDLQSGMYINCVYCGHRYGPDDRVPASMADVLKEHIEKCTEHPMSKLRVELEQVKKERDAAVKDLQIMADAASCDVCAHECQSCKDAVHKADVNGGSCFEWRGLEARA